MRLQERPFLFIDCQTTGMRPSSGHLLEIAWAKGNALPESPLEIRSFLVRLPEGETIPRRVTEITGLQDSDLTNAIEPEEVFRLLKKDVDDLGENPWAVIHYAQFERPFLEDLFRQFGVDELPFRLLCTHQLAKKLFPRLPSQNIRGLAGHFGAKFHEFKRAQAHVLATKEIWNGVATELTKIGVETPEEALQWLKSQPKTKREPYEYRIDRLKRLQLPESPGIYRMLAKSGDVLYVGKATCLRDRVNSYFRGRKGRDRRKLEMLAQVWDLEVVECPTALEAALLENDEIKRLNPPYNVSLKVGRRLLQFYSKDFSESKTTQDSEHLLGPFRAMNSIDQLRELQTGLESHNLSGVFYEEIDPELLWEGFELFVNENGRELSLFQNMRSALAFGLWLFRVQEKESRLSEEQEILEVAEEETDETTEDSAEEILLTKEDVAAKFKRLFIRAAGELRRARLLTKLLNARVSWDTDDGQHHSLDLKGGRLTGQTIAAGACPWSELSIGDYDRMSILLSEIARRPHHIERRPLN